MKQLLFKFSALVLGIVIFFAIGEVCFRIFRPSVNPLTEIVQVNPEYLLIPHSAKNGVSSVEGEFKYTAHVNALGYRGKDFKPVKDPGVLRVFAVGDSFTFGVGAEDEQTIPSLIEHYLNSHNFKTEVINAGAGHTSPITHYVNLRSIHLKYRPDVVLLLFDLTDLGDDWRQERTAVYDKKEELIGFHPMYKNGKRDWWITCVYYSEFCKWINNKIVRSFKKIQLLGFKNYVKAIKEGKRAKAEIIHSSEITSDEIQMEYDGLVMLRGREKKALIDKNWTRTAKYLTKIKTFLEAQGIPLIIVMYPHGIYVGKDQWNEGRRTWGFEQGKLYTDYYPFELVEEYAQEQGIPFINTLDSFLQQKEQKFFYGWDGHMTPAGYAVVADSIVTSPVFQHVLAEAWGRVEK